MEREQKTLHIILSKHLHPFSCNFYAIGAFVCTFSIKRNTFKKKILKEVLIKFLMLFICASKKM